MVQMYLIQGFKMEGNANNVVTLKKKGYNTAVLVLLILFAMIIGGIIYYLLCEDEMVIIKNTWMKLLIHLNLNRSYSY